MAHAPPATRRDALKQGILGLLGVLLFSVGIATMVGSELPGIRDDLAVREAARPIAGLRVVEGRCRSRLMLIQSCDVTLAWTGKDGSGTRRLSYTFVEPHAGDWSVQAVADPARPQLVTTDLGLDRLTNRIVSLAGLALAGLLLIVGCLLMIVRALRWRQAAG
ncbi:hypothetical protein J5Y09_04215 [Roseomonas sp. PWR1]|uniref:DUF3592 domain-containing protein n=1 Tax=Roseomonas nitratireducens TaxID=2820810 RepID=A0ABS4AP18_9PROT|nr:hypothetical protein [Neoroseomonas nitratireducens]MBP0463105.1 hypothetical protein [Neoroseomonas nitratireducens]